MEIDPNKETIFLSSDMVFYTIEGEGEHVGKPSVFMRLAMCNLTCNAWKTPDSPNGCDSFVSWSVSNKRTFQEIWDEFFSKEGKNYTLHLKHGAILKLTGGEPLIQQKQLFKFVRWLSHKQTELHGINTLRVDFETNATIIPDMKWFSIYDVDVTFTTSPKLSTNGDSEDKTYKPEVINWHVNNKRSGFKFVITRSEDIDEIWNKYVIPHNIPSDRIWFMPCCGSRDEHTKNAAVVAEYAKQMHVNFSPRLQLVVWNKALRV